jgi:predicted ribosome quality control (RQC) complex YloA/Tae2 family protein
MKAIKYIYLIALLAVFSCFTVTETRADNQDKAIKKESKKAAAQLEKEGWQIFGNVKSIKEGMDAHYRALGEGNGSIISIEGYGIAKDLNLAVRKSQHNAASQYATMQESKVEGTTDTKMESKSDGENASSNIEVDAHFQSTTDQTVKALKPSVIFYRVMSDGKYEVRGFYLVTAP